MEYEPSFMELEQAAAGKPETQFGPAEPPSWPQVRELAESLFAQTRDLRVALFWARSAVNTDGIEGLVQGLKLLHALMANFWEEVHPRPDPDDGDAFARVSVLGGLNALDGLLGDVRQVPILRDRRLGGLRMRDIEVALGKLERRAEEASYSEPQVAGLIGEHADLLERLRTASDAANDALKSLRSLADERFGAGTVELKTLSVMLSGLKAVIPAPVVEEAPVEGEAADGSEAGEPRRRKGGGLSSIESRQDAVRAINLICEYLERAEPTNPAQLLLRRAERLFDRNFLQLVSELAPDALNEVARIMGVSPESISGE